MLISVNVYGITANIEVDNIPLKNFIESYYSLFLVENNKNHSINIKLQKLGYLKWKNTLLDNISDCTTIWDYIKIDYNKNIYYFEDREISAILKINNGKYSIEWILKPRRIHHIINLLLQWPKRINIYYNRFITKTLIHDIIFSLLYEKLWINILHATAVSNWKKTFIFTWLWWSWKSTLWAAFHQKWYSILADNYALVKDNYLYPFPEMPRITKSTWEMLKLNKWKKADWIKTYVNNNISNIKNQPYKIDKVFICTYGKDFDIIKLKNQWDIIETLVWINNYTKEFPEYLNFALLPLLWVQKTQIQKLENLKEFVNKNSFYFLKNSKNIYDNLKIIENV